MNNIWKYSLVLAFSIICDQLIKGSIQSLLEYEGATKPLFKSLVLIIRERNYFFPMGFSLGASEKIANTIAILADSLLMFGCLYRIVIFRNKDPFMGWGYTLIFSGLFTSWMDRFSQGFTLNYLSFLGISTSFGDLLFLFGLIIVLVKEVFRYRNATNPL